MEVLSIAGVFQSLFFAVFLLSKQENKKANILLGIWLLFLALFFVEMWINSSATYLAHPNLIGAFSGVTFLFGPFLLLYTLFLANHQRQWRVIDVLHFLPFLLYYGYYFLSFFPLEETVKLNAMAQIIKGEIPLNIFVISFIKAIHGIAYSGFTLLFLGRYKSAIQDNFSNTAKINLQWLTKLSYGFLAIYTLAFIVQITSLFGQYIGEGPIGLLSVLLIFMVAFLGLRQGALFNEANSGSEQEEHVLKVKYLHSRMDERDIDQLKNRLIKVFESEKPYLDPEFRLSELALKMNIHANELSQVINEGFGQNFYTLVNSYRIEEVKRNIQDQQNNNLTLLAIGLQSGFNSKTTFNTVFKKMTGLTPSQFKKQVDSLTA